ncbi:hypothetical protein ACFYYB_07815 [Streptomyces sp. NPDC002886]|uniref:hypothetical protein n=1 Tax=Streptomyces sp. NPDC002886 TaxID=3364667 RepID=UPI0036BF7C7B
MKMTMPLVTAALSEGERTASHSVRLAGRELGPQVRNWSLDRAYATDLPASMRAFSGSSSAQLDVTLSGAAGKPAPALYGPWAPRATGDIVRPSQSVVHAWGVGGYPLDTFRGTVRTRSGSSGEDAVRVSALDGAERLRFPARLPRPDRVLANELTFGVATSWAASPVWVVDHLLRLGGIHTCPPPRSTAILYASLHGGVAPNIGYLEDTSGLWAYWTDYKAPWESAALGDDRISDADYIPRTKPVNRRSDGLWLEHWLDTTGNTTSDEGIARIHTTWIANGLYRCYVTMEANFQSGKLTVWNGTNADYNANQALQWTFDQLKAPGLWHIGWWLSWSTTGVPTLSPVVTNQIGVAQTFSDAVLSATPVPPANLDQVRLSIKQIRAECFQVSQQTSRPNSPAEFSQAGTWKRGASLSKPRFPLENIPRVEGSAWDVITQIAKTTLATAEFDSNGFFRWRDHTRWETVPTQPALTVSSTRELASLTVGEEIDACRNYVAVKWSNWGRVKGDQLTPVAEARTGTAIAAGATLTRVLPIGEDQWDPRTPNVYVDRLPDCVSIKATADSDSAGVYGAVEVTLTRDGGQVTLSMRNRASYTVYYHGVSAFARTTSSDSPAGPTDTLTTVQSSASQRAYGVQVYEHQGTEWVQYRDSAAELASAILAAGQYPIPSLQSVEILADPRLELGDVVRVVDRTGAALDTLAWVVGIKTNGGDDGRVTQILTLRGTKANGIPADTGLVPDPPTNPNAPPP